MNAKDLGNFKKREQKRKPAVTLAMTVEGPFAPPKKGFWKFLKDLFLAPDLDFKAFERLEAKRSRHQIESGRFF